MKQSSINHDCRPASTPLGVTTNWSIAEINGPNDAVGKNVAEDLLKVCKVH